MRKFVLAALVAVAALGQSACGTYIEPGNVGIVVDNTGGGVQDKVLKEGWHSRAPFATTIIEYPTYIQNLILSQSRDKDEPDESIIVNSMEAQPISLDVSLAFVVRPETAPTLYKKFRKDVDVISHTFVKQTVKSTMQDAAGVMTTADIIGPKKGELQDAAKKSLAAQLAPFGIDVQQFTINAVRPPQAMVQAIQAKNAMEQEALRIKNRLLAQEYAARGDSIEAEGAAKATMARARAAADSIELLARANEKMSTSISPSLIEYTKARQWNGALPNFMGSSVQPYMQIKP